VSGFRGFREFHFLGRPVEAAGRHTPPQDTISSNIVGIDTVCTV